MRHETFPKPYADTFRIGQAAEARIAIRLATKWLAEHRGPARFPFKQPKVIDTSAYSAFDIRPFDWRREQARLCIAEIRRARAVLAMIGARHD